MNVILFGPPGIGKSTIIEAIRDELSTFPKGDLTAIDLEQVYPNFIRFEMPLLCHNTIFGGADLDPKQEYPGCKKVLLYLPQEKYAARRALRDVHDMLKRRQDTQNIDEWKDLIDWDAITPVGQSVRRAMTRVYSLCGKWAMR